MIEWWEPHAEALQTAGVSDGIRNGCPRIWATILIASQLEPEEWYLRIEGELMADSILNRIATASRYLDIEGPNMREYFAKQKENKE